MSNLVLSNEGRLGWSDGIGVRPLNFLTEHEVNDYVVLSEADPELTWANVPIEKAFSKIWWFVFILSAGMNYPGDLCKRKWGGSMEN